MNKTCWDRSVVLLAAFLIEIGEEGCDRILNSARNEHFVGMGWAAKLLDRGYDALVVGDYVHKDGEKVFHPHRLMLNLLSQITDEGEKQDMLQQGYHRAFVVQKQPQGVE